MLSHCSLAPHLRLSLDGGWDNLRKSQLDNMDADGVTQPYPLSHFEDSGFTVLAISWWLAARANLCMRTGEGLVSGLRASIACQSCRDDVIVWDRLGCQRSPGRDVPYSPSTHPSQCWIMEIPEPRQRESKLNASAYCCSVSISKCLRGRK